MSRTTVFEGLNDLEGRTIPRQIEYHTEKCVSRSFFSEQRQIEEEGIVDQNNLISMGNPQPLFTNNPGTGDETVFGVPTYLKVKQQFGNIEFEDTSVGSVIGAIGFGTSGETDVDQTFKNVKIRGAATDTVVGSGGDQVNFMMGFQVFVITNWAYLFSTIAIIFSVFK